MALLLLAEEPRARIWAEVFEAAGEALLTSETAVDDPAAVTHLACWTPPEDLACYPNLELVLSVGAGVDQMPDLPAGVTLARTLAPSISTMVRDWVVMATLMLHRDMPHYIAQAGQGQWQPQDVRPARATRIGILGLGAIGTEVALTLSQMGFEVHALSRSAKPCNGLTVFGPEDEDAFLASCDLLINLLPLTQETRGKLNADYLARLPRGARLVQAGRGAQLDHDALWAALETGQIHSAMLDVTDPEPLPADHWLWRHPRVLVTPHIASFTDPREGAEHALCVLRASRTGTQIPGQVDRARGY